VLIIALAALVILAAGWVGYPMVAAVIARRSRAVAGGTHEPIRSVSVVIASRDDPDVIAQRVENILETHYPSERLEVIVALDANAARALHPYRAALMDRAAVVLGDAPGGKAAALNAGVRRATGDVLVFADSRQSFASNAIPKLIELLEDGQFGAASGTLVLAPERYDRTILGLFWQYELLLRRLESSIHSLVGVTGAIYCLRRNLWTPLPANLICDDLFVPLTLAMHGHRVGHSEQAYAYDPRHFNRQEEFKRRVRTLTGILQLCAWFPSILLPWKNPVWIQFTCHKLLRIVTPYLVLIGAIGVLPRLLARTSTMGMLGLAAVAALAVLLTFIVRPDGLKQLGAQLVWAAWLHVAPIQATLNAVRRNWDVW